MKLLGIDYGKKRIGLAIADDQMKIASPLETIQNKSKSQVIGKITEICYNEKVRKVIIGMPKHLSGARHELENEVKRFGSLLEKELKLSITYEDERLTSKVAQEKSKGLSKTKEKLDELSAQEILQSYLDKFS